MSEFFLKNSACLLSISPPSNGPRTDEPLLFEVATLNSSLNPFVFIESIISQISTGGQISVDSG